MTTQPFPTSSLRDMPEGSGTSYVTSLIAMNISDHASAFVDEPDVPIPATVAPVLLTRIMAARRFLRRHSAQKVSLTEEGLTYDDDALNLGEFRVGYSEVRVFLSGPIYLFLEGKHDCEQWVEFELEGLGELADVSPA